MSKSVELIKIEHVSKKFNGKVVLNDFSTTLKTGEIVGLIGRSGAGTLMQKSIIAGFQRKINRELCFFEKTKEENAKINKSLPRAAK